MVASSDDWGTKPEGTRWGVVKYLNGGADAVIQSRKDDAKKQMKEFCAPSNYRVIETSEKSELAFYQASGGSFNYLHLKFECLD